MRLLHVSGSVANHEVIHFFRFWQALEEFSRRLRGAGSHNATDDMVAIVEEPLAEEIAEFRDGLLRKLDRGSVTQAMDGFIGQDVIAADIARIRSMSADSSSWNMLESKLGFGRAQSTAQQLQLHLVFKCILSWLRKICQEYRCGSRAAKLRSVRDVAGCGWREACLHLTTAGWDVEHALQGFYAAQAPAGSITRIGTSWSSRGAKMSKDETECPICMNPYASQDGVAMGAPIQLGCCFQVLCRACHEKLVNNQNMLSCPFCRVVDHVPREARQREGGARQRSDSLGRLCQTAERIASGACRALDGIREVGRTRFARRDLEGHYQHDAYYRTLPRAPIIPTMVLA